MNQMQLTTCLPVCKSSFSHSGALIFFIFLHSLFKKAHFAASFVPVASVEHRTTHPLVEIGSPSRPKNWTPVRPIRSAQPQLAVNSMWNTEQVKLKKFIVCFLGRLVNI